MRKMLILFVLVLAGAWARASLAACPGTSACVYNKGCPKGSKPVKPGRSIQNKAGNYGGGMWVPAGLTDVVNSTFDGNQAAEGGGIAAGFGSMVNVASTLFVSNTATDSGSATLVNANGSNTSVVNHYNGFFGNTGQDYTNTYGDLGLLIAAPLLLLARPELAGDQRRHPGLSLQRC